MRELLERLVAEGAFPGAVVRASVAGEEVAAACAGRTSVAPDASAVTLDTVYDLASVTKPFVSAAVLTLVRDGRIGLEQAVGELVDDLPAEKAALTIRRLLAHTAGLPSVPELHVEHPGRDELDAALRAVPLAGAPGGRVLYTSLGYQLLGWAVEAAAGTTLDRYLADAVLGPCGLRRAAFRPAGGAEAAIAPTEWSPVRERLVHGEVHDENAWILGGVCGHTGLFASAAEVLRFGEALLDGAWLGDARELLWRDLTGGLEPCRSAAFVLDDPQFGRWPAPCWAHTGFTGTSLCLVPELGVAAVVLSNRVNPTRANERIVEARRRIHEALRDRVAAREGEAA